MAAPGGADQPGLAEQIQLLREQNNLLVQQNLQLQQGRPAARVQPQPERRRFLEPPTEADLDEQRLYLIPATLTRGPNSHRLPTDVAGAQGEPHLLNLTSEYIYLHAVEKGKKHDSTVLRILLSLLSYLEVLEFGLSSARAQALAAEALTENLVAAVEAQLRPVAAVEQEGAEEEARLLAAGQRAQLLERLRGIDNGTTLLTETVARAAGSAEGVRAIAAYGEGLQRTYLSPDHLVPHFLRLAVETSESIAAHDRACALGATAASAADNLSLLRALLAVAICFMTMSRPISILLLPTTDLTADPDSASHCVTVTRQHVKTDHGIDRNQPGRFPLSFPRRFAGLATALRNFTAARAAVYPTATHFFELPGERFTEKTNFGDALGRMLNAADHCPAAARRTRVHGALSSLWWRVCCGNGSPSAQQNRVPRRMGRGLETNPNPNPITLIQ
ncbi:core-binding domain-containing protein [Pseudoscourfieldia marina]